MHPLQKMLEAADMNVRSYSGRGMYGKECLAFTTGEGSGLGDVLADILQNCLDLAEEQGGRGATDEIADAFRNMSSDSMGRGTVYYFPRIPYTDESVETCEECEAEFEDANNRMSELHLESCSLHPISDSSQCVDPKCEGAGTYHDHPVSKT